MKLSISNIAWDASDDARVYDWMQEYGFTGLEIAPTRVFPNHPYSDLQRASGWRQELERQYGFCVPSIQSIWFGRSEKLFGEREEYNALIAYTKEAIDFAASLGCKNLVFGCPRNRNMPEGADRRTAVCFFKELGDYAAKRKAVIGMEANPPIYNTNFINDTASALQLVKDVDSRGFFLNLDVGTMIQNGESVEELQEEVNAISHVHISEPGLKPIAKRRIHEDLAALLYQNHYGGFVSIEMGRQEDVNILKAVMAYVKEIFG